MRSRTGFSADPGHGQKRGGFTLLEVLVSSLVMAGIMIAAMSHLWYASEVWRRGQQVVMVENQVRMVHDLVKREMLMARDVMEPTVGATSSYIYYAISVASPPSTVGTARFFLKWNDGSAPEPFTLNRNLHANDLGLNAAFAQESFLARHQFLVARDIATFTVTRVSTWTLDVTIGALSTAMRADGETQPAAAEISTTLLLPGLAP